MKKIIDVLVVLILTFTASVPAHAKIVFKNEFLIEDDGANTFILDSKDNVDTDLTLQFGNTLAKTLHFDTVNSWFEFNDSIAVFGSGFIENTDVGQSFRVNDSKTDPSPFLIDDDGNVGIHNGAPAAPLDISGTGELIHLGDGTANNINLTFDDGTDHTLTWNNGGIRFELSDDLFVGGGIEVSGNIDFNLNQANEFRFENLGIAPTCDAGSTGLTYFDTSNSDSYMCDGSAFQILNETHYHNGAEVENIKTATVTSTTTGENTTIYLTDDGTINGNKLFTSVYFVSAAASEIQTAAEAPAMTGYSYDAGTGALVIKFLESANILGLGVESLTAEEAGTPFSIFAVGI